MAHREKYVDPEKAELLADLANNFAAFEAHGDSKVEEKKPGQESGMIMKL